MRVAGVVLACTLAAAGAVKGAPTEDQFTPPDWLKRPTRDELIGLWPLAAAKQAIEGKAVVTCVVTLQGNMRDCTVTSESPAGMGFGAAALALTPQFLFKPATRNGTPIESKISVPVSFPKLDGAVRAALMRRSESSEWSRSPRKVNTGYYTIGAWDEAPTVADVAAAYPAKARSEKISGHATLDCRITRFRGLDQCRVITEYPLGAGFGGAARSLAAKFKSPAPADGAEPMTDGHTHIPFTFSPELLAAAAPLIGTPQWSGTPTAEDFTAAFPKAATAAGVLKARAVLSCIVTPNGGVTGCAVASEDPPGLGFGAATLSLADKFRLTNWTSEGLPTAGGRVTIPIRYELQQAAAAPTQAGGAR